MQPHSHYVVHEDESGDPFAATRVVEQGERVIYVGGEQPNEGAQTLQTTTSVDSEAPLGSGPANWTQVKPTVRE